MTNGSLIPRGLDLCRHSWDVILQKGPSKIQFWFIALAIGVASGYAAVAFMTGIELLQTALYGIDDPNRLHSFAATLPWYWVLLLPAVGGLIVGYILTRFTPDGRVRGPAEVIEASAMKEGRVEPRAGLASIAASLITLSSGGSSGREGPVVHMVGMIAGWVSNRINADGITGRDLLGCAVAAGVAASFNAPLAGALFAMEVVLRHFSVHAFAPITIAAVSGSVISRTHFGDVTEFTLPEAGMLAFYTELPAFLILGLVCGLVGVTLMRSVFLAEDFANRMQGLLRLPAMLRPALSGLMLGGIAIFFPHIIGVGYETTSAALSGDLILQEAIVFAVLKVLAVSITMGGRMGGGIFSPALMTGALTGLAFGLIATAMFPNNSGSETLYALAGMGAVGAAVLGAPISTTLIVFELTGDWQTGLAVMVAVSIASALSSRLVDRSFFLTQLERRGIHLAAGPQAYLLAMFKVSGVMKSPDHPRAPPEDRVRRALNEALFVAPGDTLEKAMPLFERSNSDFLAVVRFGESDQAPEVLGVLLHVDALRVYNRALAATAAEEHS
ncbi:chloride channel protein [Jannaschia pohangensis]|uniref:Chloride channel protein, CIC family n=1 Tax=Jannaschia pohangensis TaxID=390807 RepID=A0A1I3IQZ2_9RHOB|nr:chloride channel protein [Jannaschia pohangensis]SFI50384.1 chloride channel protein, CIC family [Jannaschia pohangensis]